MGSINKRSTISSTLGLGLSNLPTVGYQGSDHNHTALPQRTRALGKDESAVVGTSSWHNNASRVAQVIIWFSRPFHCPFCARSITVCIGQTQPTSHTAMGSDRLALLVDGDNVSAKVITGVLAEIAKHGTASVRRIYGDWTLPNLGPWKKCLLEHSIQPVQQFAYTTGKNATDGAMIIDAMDLLYTGRFDGFCLVSSDSDFTRLAVRIREQGVTVYGFGERKTPRPLISACDRFYYFHALETGPSIDEARPTNNADAVARRPVVPAIQGDQADAAVSPITAPARSGPATGRLDGEALKILRMAVEACAEDDGQANLANVGSYLTKQSPDFNAANYGFKKLRDLAEASGILKVELVQRKSAAPVCMVQLNDTSEKVKKRRRLS